MTYVPSDDTAHRLGAAALGMFAGVALGIALVVLGFATGSFGPSIPRFVFGGGACGAVTGLFFPAVAMSIAEGTVHFFVGAASTAVEGPLSPEPGTPRWLVAAFFFGVAYGWVLWWLS